MARGAGRAVFRPLLPVAVRRHGAVQRAHRQPDAAPERHCHGAALRPHPRRFALRRVARLDPEDRRRDDGGHALLLMAVIAPMLTGIVVRTFAWITILSDKGVINATLMAAGVIATPLPLMYNELGTVIALVHIYVPFMVLTLAGVIGRIDERLEEAAMSLGASPLRAFLEVTLPLSLPGILAGSLLVFGLAISAYVTPYLMGGQQVLTLPMLIYQQVAATFNLAFAGALGVVLLVVSIALVVAYNHVLGRMSRREDLA